MNINTMQVADPSKDAKLDTKTVAGLQSMGETARTVGEAGKQLIAGIKDKVTLQGLGTRLAPYTQEILFGAADTYVGAAGALAGKTATGLTIAGGALGAVHGAKAIVHWIQGLAAADSSDIKGLRYHMGKATGESLAGIGMFSALAGSPGAGLPLVLTGMGISGLVQTSLDANGNPAGGKAERRAALGKEALLGVASAYTALVGSSAPLLSISLAALQGLRALQHVIAAVSRMDASSRHPEAWREVKHHGWRALGSGLSSLALGLSAAASGGTASLAPLVLAGTAIYAVAEQAGLEARST